MYLKSLKRKTISCSAGCWDWPRLREPRSRHQQRVLGWLRPRLLSLTRPPSPAVSFSGARSWPPQSQQLFSLKLAMKAGVEGAKSLAQL